MCGRISPGQHCTRVVLHARSLSGNFSARHRQRHQQWNSSSERRFIGTEGIWPLVKPTGSAVHPLHQPRICSEYRSADVVEADIDAFSPVIDLIRLAQVFAPIVE